MLLLKKPRHVPGDLEMNNREKVVHCKKSQYQVYIGRGRNNKWGNPFRIGQHGSREDVIRKYREWFLKQDHLLEALPELFGKVVACWCAPHACHGDVLVEYADKLQSYLESSGEKDLQATRIRIILS